MTIVQITCNLFICVNFYT